MHCSFSLPTTSRLSRVAQVFARPTSFLPWILPRINKVTSFILSWAVHWGTSSYLQESFLQVQEPPHKNSFWSLSSTLCYGSLLGDPNVSNKKIFKTLFPVPVTNMVSDAFSGGGGGGGNWLWKQMENNFIPSSTATTLGTKSRTIKLFSNFLVKDGGSFGAKGNTILYWRGYKARNIRLDDGQTNRAVSVAGYLQSAGGELSSLELLFVCFVWFSILATQKQKLQMI